nr:methyltransferase domain-containing protein [Nocardioides flavescens]
MSFADERGRPFVDLLARVGAESPDAVVDLGCGPGNLTALLAQRWPGARVAGVDSSPAMIDRARSEQAGSSVTFSVGDLRDWAPAGPVDVLVSNATLQWVPGHLDLLPRLLDAVAPGGWLAFQVPGNFDEPSHTLRAELAAEPAYAETTVGIEAPASHDPVDYYDALTVAGASDVDVWETTYTHVLRGSDPVFTWVSATGARPTLEALGEGPLRAAFEEEFKRRLAAAYPTREGGTVLLPFRRVFAVARH